MTVTASSFGNERLKTLLQGTLPRDLSLLSDIEFFQLPDFELQGSLEGVFASWSKVRLIRLDKNRFTGSLPINLGVETPSIQTLNLAQNDFAGAIPQSWGRLQQLNTLQLGNNQLGGRISPVLGDMSSLSKSK